MDAAKRIEDGDYAKYGKSYGCISNYDELIADCIARNDVPRYAVDWLAESIRNGAEVESLAIYDSIERGLPYLCETESETWLFDNEENPMLDSAEGIYKALLYYEYRTIKNPNKSNFWRNRLLLLASNGDFMAQGLICWKCGFIFQDGRYEGVLPQNVWEELKNSYEKSILNSCDAGDPYAQLAVAKFNRDINDGKKQALYISAIEKGLTDACYYYAQFLDQKRFIANGNTVCMPPYGTDEWQEYMREELSLYKKGAEFNNGVMAGYCQFRLADMYKCGDGGVFKDASLAQVWFKKAYENGYFRAKNYIDS